ncbi:VWA domain-containing protein [Alkalimarinus coralli]|uniref:VWA domain-containing protein n=1 Tax=Alkalimarinus coralli TaxID=2935863 RepID=UPI00202B0935|nr:VWA domain-containing protein [Alkalimarinus coralli]
MAFLDTLYQFHFLRPLWLLVLFLVPLILWFSHKRQSEVDSDWSKAIPPELLQHLLVGNQSSSGTTDNWKWFAIIIALLALGLAGPSWQKKPQPLHQQSDNLAIVLDLSLSMLASDQKPNRLTRAKHKLQDLLEQRKEGNTALIVYSGDSYVVTPLTDDTNTLKSMLPPLDPFIMPAMGSRPELAIEQAIDVLKNGGATNGKILLITDGIEPDNLQQISERLSNTSYPLSVLAVGTEQGGPINIPERGYLKDKGSVIIPKTDFDLLEQLASNHSGVMEPIQLDDSDIESLKAVMSVDTNSKNSNNLADTEAENSLYDQWHDEGYWFALILIPIVLLGYKRGAFSLVLLLSFTLQPKDAMAFEWKDLWKTPDQQAMEIVENNPAKAAELFEDPQWKGTAQYKAKQYEEAQQSFETATTTTALYNQATALAQQQKFQEAIEAYEEVLQQDPDFEDAATNKALIEKFLEEQQSQEQQSQDQSSDQSESSDSDSKDQQQSDGQQGDSQDQEQSQDQSQDQQASQNNESSGGQQQDQQQGQSQQSDQASSDQTQPDQDQAEQQQADNKQSEQEQSEKQEQQQAQGAEKTDKDSKAEQNPQQAQASEQDQLTDEETQAFEQWMRRVPDDPGGLLRRKFAQQYQQKRGRQSQQEGQPIW